MGLYQRNGFIIVKIYYKWRFQLWVYLYWVLPFEYLDGMFYIILLKGLLYAAIYIHCIELNKNEKIQPTIDPCGSS